MVAPKTACNRCPNCGEAFLPDVLVCAKCKTILAAPSGKKRTPTWVIALLFAIILGLAGYIIYLIQSQVIQHNY